MCGQAEDGRESVAHITAGREGSLPEAWYLIWESIKAGAHRVPAAKLGGLEAADDVLESSSHYKVLLLQPKLLPLEELGTM